MSVASWALLAGMAAWFAAMQVGDPFLLRGGPALLPVAGVALLAVLAFAGWSTGRSRLLAACIAFLQITLFTLLAVALSYAIAARAGPLMDAQLAAADRAIGFDSAALAQMIDSSALATGAAVLAYHSLIPQMIVAVVALSAVARFAELRLMVLAALVSGLATLLLSGLVPALGALIDPASHRHLPESVAWMHHERILGLRAGTLRTVDFGVMTGIVSFPSYHAALCVIFIWAFRQVRPLASAGTCWGVATVCSTPTIGGHYAVDVLAGLALGAASLWLARAVIEPKTVGLRQRGGLAGAATMRRLSSSVSRC